MKTKDKCELCGCSNFNLKFPGNIKSLDFENFAQYAYYGDIFQCAKCGLVRQKVDLTSEQVLALIKNEKYLNEAIGQLALDEKYVQFNTLISFAEKYAELNNAKLLDIGANTGIYLNLMKRYSSNLFGLEPSKEAAKFAQDSGLNVQNGVIAEGNFENNAFDIVTMWDVVEHLSTPQTDFEKINPWLKVGGKFFITTHNIESLFAKLMGKRYPMLMYQHFFHFSPKTLSAMLEQKGFKVLGIHQVNKSWSISYLHNLIDKLWPDSQLAQLARTIIGPIAKSKTMGKMHISFPIRDFFFIAVEKI